MIRFVLALIFVLASSTARADFPFDPDGPGPKPVVQVGAFDFLVGNSLAKGALSGNTWTLYYQASLGSLTDKDTREIPGTGLNVDHEITVVAAISAKTLTPGPFLTFALEPAAANFIRIYHDDKVNANPLEGTGYADGTLILESFTTDDLMGGLWILPQITNLDMFGNGNQWPGVQSQRAIGSLQCSSVVSSFSRDFFQIGGQRISRISINSSEAAPYRQMKPSKLFWNGTDTFAPAVGSINLKSGPDAMTQADANASFSVE